MMSKLYSDNYMTDVKRRVFRIFFLRFFAVGLSCITLLSCATSAPLNSEVLIRISNQSDVLLENVHIGRRIIKKDSYSNTNYLTEFKRVNHGEISEYKRIRDTHWGLDRFLVNIKPRGYGRMSQILPSNSNRLQDALRIDYGIKSSAKHPYSGEMQLGYILPSGKYTFSVIRKERALVLEIKKD